MCHCFLTALSCPLNLNGFTVHTYPSIHPSTNQVKFLFPPGRAENESPKNEWLNIFSGSKLSQKQSCWQKGSGGGKEYNCGIQIINIICIIHWTNMFKVSNPYTSLIIFRIHYRQQLIQAHEPRLKLQTSSSRSRVSDIQICNYAPSLHEPP